MLLSFTVANWMSFQSPVTFSMVATQERYFSERLTSLDKYNNRVLPISALYGGNATGKTNFVEAFSFVKNMVVNPLPVERKIPVRPFKLSEECQNKPCQFLFNILIENNIYAFNFSVNAESIIEEELFIFKSKTNKKCIYRRDGQTYYDNFGKFYENSNVELLNFVKNVTRSNQLFLTNTISLNINVFKQIYDWFDKKLVIIRPDDRYMSFFDLFSKNSKSHSIAEDTLYKLDTGISRLDYEDIPLEGKQLPQNLKSFLEMNLPEGKSIFIDGILYLRENGKITAKQLKTFHTGAEGFEAEFTLNEESDGTLRAMHLLPAILNFNGEETVYVIDEIDKSLHTLLLRKIIEIFLSNRSKSNKNQLIMTTHDVLLMDTKLLRRDEMWVTERKNDGSSELIAFSDFKEIYKDKDIRKSYLQGRLGGIPNISFEEVL